ncbi:base plate wedge component [Synechococcus phage S-PM2]|uniref:Base plate wedge component n=1 Tax=Synechococcus phage S-PM2 TaxID=238854 RepID=Q5GQD7_BPSYP|nr:baseplate wedge subunit [Synechococcus phage S-PM2]CAF34265.1 base plate wedge component [Synechococcus phage S-PM2]CFW42418.1 base plate wedge component [Synechococcus phage S-PM2]
MYFSLLPDIKYDVKPISYPFSESNFVVAKNFFRRFKISDDFYSYAVFFRQYQVGDFEQPWQVANINYENPEYDWIILLTNNIVNPLFDWPMDSYTLRKYIEGKYDDPYATIHHREIVSAESQINIFGKVIKKPGLIVDEAFENGSIKYYDDNLGIQTISASSITKRVTIFEYEEGVNDSKREIYLLKPKYIDGFIDEFRRANKYKDSSDFISTRLKKTGV